MQDRLEAIEQTNDFQSVPCGDDIRILLFARCDREKEDWFRRFTAASVGAIVDQEAQFPDMVMVNEDEVMAAVKAAALANQDRDSIDSTDERIMTGEVGSNIVPVKSDIESEDGRKSSRSSSVYEGLLLTSCAARGPANYLKFMTIFQVSGRFYSIVSFLFILVFVFSFMIFVQQKACSLKSIPVIRAYPTESPNKKVRFYDLTFLFFFCFI